MNSNSVSKPGPPQQGPQPGVMVVRATHEYTPVNNDELHIRPGDLIAITNPEEGGWWEGTLGSRTGWFPSNYVVQVDPSQAPTTSLPPSPHTADEYRGTLVQELCESESRFVADMEDFLDTTFAGICAKINSSTTTTNCDLLQSLRQTYSAILTAHATHILGPLRSHVESLLQGSTTPTTSQLRVGRIFLTAAPHLHPVHTAYCRLHPRFVSFIERHQDALSPAAEPDGVLRIITCLSAPFRRVVAYGGLLNELECHVESFHGDRGDLQRSVAVYRDLEKQLNAIRKQKEMELEVLVPGAIKDFEGTDINALGEIILMNLVLVGGSREPRYFVLFPNTILVLAYDSVANQFSYHGRICVSGITVASLADGEHQGFAVANAIEISGPTIHPLIAQCPTPAIKSTWISTLTDLIRKTRCYSSTNTPSTPTPPQQVQLQLQYTPPYVRLVLHFRALHESGLLRVQTPPLRRFKCLSKLHSSSGSDGGVPAARRPVLVRQDAFDLDDGDEEEYNNHEVAPDSDSVDSGCGDSCCFSGSFSSNVLIRVEEGQPEPVYRAALYAHWGLKLEYC